MAAPITETHKRHWNYICSLKPEWDGQGLKLGDNYVMFYAERALMERHFELLCEDTVSPRVLDIGAGLGVFANVACSRPISSYTGVELHPEVADRLEEQLQQLGTNVLSTIIAKPWQECLNQLDMYDLIMYDTWPPDDLKENDFSWFIENLCRHKLAKNGRFSFFCNGAPSKSRIDVLKAHFRGLHVEQFEVRDVPSSWNKATPICTICVASSPKRPDKQ